ncbi:MAG: hypothetical protein IIC24_09340 [Chloroflexi bacterium]|nr:hypothetical protein [Chloroflexota bacterium]
MKTVKINSRAMFAFEFSLGNTPDGMASFHPTVGKLQELVVGIELEVAFSVGSKKKRYWKPGAHQSASKMQLNI